MIEGMGNSLSLVSVVSTEQDERLLYHNLRLLRELNPNNAEGITWLVVCNRPISDPRLTEDKAVQRLPGVENANAASTAGAGSYHHSQALTSAIPFVKTRYALFIDPDCFIVRREWIKDVLGEMSSRGLSFFGVPNHPKKYTSWRNFPYVAGLFVDLSKVAKKDVDFTPYADEMEWLRRLHTTVLAKMVVAGGKTADMPARVRPDARMILTMLRSRLLNAVFGGQLLVANPWPGTSGDTSIRLYDRFARHPQHRWDYATPLWDHREIFEKYSSWQRLLWRLLPEALRYVPKDGKVATVGGFKSYGACDVENIFRCESYIWRDAPFAFHIRGNGVKDLPSQTLEDVFASFARRGG